jgi:hypothetical protein
MSEPINLNKARKAKARAAKEADAAANRVRFGRSKAQKAVDKRETERAARKLDDTKREP